MAPISDYGVRSGTPVVAYNIYLVPRLELATPNGHSITPSRSRGQALRLGGGLARSVGSREVIFAKDERIAPNATNKETGVNRAPHKR